METKRPLTTLQKLYTKTDGKRMTLMEIYLKYGLEGHCVNYPNLSKEEVKNIMTEHWSVCEPSGKMHLIGAVTAGRF